MLEMLRELMKEVVADDELFKLSAQAMKKGYDALVEAGFTEDQAVRIVAGQGMGFKPGS